MYIYKSQKFLILFACPTVVVLEDNTSNIKFFFGYPDKIDLKDNY